MKAQQLWPSPSEGLIQRTGIFCGLSVLWVSFDEEGIRVRRSVSPGLTWPPRCYMLLFFSSFCLSAFFVLLQPCVWHSLCRTHTFSPQLCLLRAPALSCIAMETETIFALKVLCWILWTLCPSYRYSLQTKFPQMCMWLIVRSENPGDLQYLKRNMHAPKIQYVFMTNVCMQNYRSHHQWQ